MEIIGIFTPGIIFPCLSLLSSIMQSISFDIPKKLSAVVAFAGAPYPIILFPSFVYYFSKKKTTLSVDTLCMGYHVVAEKI